MVGNEWINLRYVGVRINNLLVLHFDDERGWVVLLMIINHLAYQKQEYRKIIILLSTCLYRAQH